MKKLFKFKLLDSYHQSLEGIAVNCMGKSLFGHRLALPSEKKSLNGRLKAQSEMEKMLVEFLANRGPDRTAIRALLAYHAKILRHLHSIDLYPTCDTCGLSSIYYQHIALPLLLIRLTRRANKHTQGVLFHLHHMLQQLPEKYPANIQSYMRQQLNRWQLNNGLTPKPISWIREIRSSSYPSWNTYKLSFSEWQEKQPISEAQSEAAYDQVKSLYMAGLLFSTVKKILDKFKPFSFYTERMLALESNSFSLSAYGQMMAKAAQHQEPAAFLSEHKKQTGSTDATKKLITYRNCLFMPYVLQEQFKSDLTSDKKLLRLRKLLMKSGVEGNHLITNYFNQLDGLGYVLRALLSSVMAFEQLVDWVTPEMFEQSVHLVKDEIRKGQPVPSTEREIIRALTQVLSELANQQHPGASCNTLAIFLYCFRYSDESVQPNANAAMERLFWDTHSKPYTEQACEYMLIAAYNNFITRFAAPDAVNSLLCNPLGRLEQSLAVYFQSRHLGLKQATNAAFRKDRPIVRLGSKYPYQALQDVAHDVARLALSSNLSSRLPNIQAFVDLSEDEKKQMFAVLDKAQYEKDNE
ncbi:hypothetical protein [Echinimonas agarilytica]|uniref:Uncharacterized protein n=1 Tax=Echinimonas agarilytica TaxID=1215918 RepID=A0AA41W3M3_9GAMM|nr:hypothetical protein [Echinimonas agarilytica]MCM2678181.1 hypothetical protein [Echinimonas agarilytica]